MNKKRFSSFLIIGLIIINTFSVLGCGNGQPMTIKDPIVVNGFKLNTFVSIASYVNVSKDILNEALSMCDTYEAMCSRTANNSTLKKVNNHEITEVSGELAEMIKQGLYYSELSNGAFDITIGSVSSLWDFNAEKPRVPDATAISEGLKFVNYKNVKLKPKPDTSDTYTIEMPKGTILDLGAIAKGYIADRIKEFLLSKGVSRAIINLGGNVLCVGSKNDSTNFNVGIRRPFADGNDVLCTLTIADKSSVSSGTYERCFEDAGTFYHHILNPETGYPYDNGISAITIISDSSFEGDCLSTTCFAMGVDEGLKLINSLPDVEAFFVTEKGDIIYSDNAKAFILNQ